MQSFFSSSQDLKTIRAETLYAAHLAEHNIPITAADHAGPLFRKMFPDSEIAKQYGSGRTKTTSILVTLANNDDACLTELMKRSVFSLATDGSTDMDDIKMYPICGQDF